MSFDDDLDLETRLRRIAANPQPDPPASVYRRLDEIGRGDRSRTSGVELSRIRVGRRAPSGLHRVGALGSLAAVLIVAVSVTALFFAARGPHNGATWTLRADAGQGEWTGLEWHDITSTSGAIGTQQQWYGWGYSTSFVAWRGGFAMVGGDFDVWVSKDGLVWSRAVGGPHFAGLATLGGDIIAGGQAINGSGSGLWLTSDAVTWNPVTVPFELASVSGLAGSSSGVVVVTTAPNSGDPRGPSSIYFSADARAWTQTTLPADLASARTVNVNPFLGGFVATGLVSDPNGSTTYTSGTGDESHYSERAWISHDGLTWSTYDPVLPPTNVSSNVPPWTWMPVGRLGAGNGLIHSTDGGVTWLADSDSFPGLLSGQSIAWDGNRIVMSAGSGARFYLSEGDGHWRDLQQGGDVGSLPADGQVLLLPNGVLWVAGERVYFGQALSGISPQGSLGWPTTASPGPTLPFQTSTPAMLETATPNFVPPVTGFPSP